MADYLYNGVELPDINEIWTEEIKVQHPYAYIVRSFLGYRLTCTNSPLYQARFTDAEELTYPISAGREVQYIQYSCDFGGSAWSYYDSGLKKNPEPNDIRWCNTDLKICITDTKSTSFTLTDEVYLPASTPVPVATNTLDPTALLMGWMVGKRVAGLRKTQTDVPVVPDEPIAYLYNGVRLPDINQVWTDEVKAQYPYAYMDGGLLADMGANYDGYVAQLVLTNRPLKYLRNGVIGIYIGNSAEDDGSTYSYTSFTVCTSQEYCELIGAQANTWMDDNSGDDGISTGVVFGLLWSSYDILNPDGTTYLAASEPIPVYE